MLLTNVRIETGFDRMNQQVIHTRTQLVQIRVVAGEIQAIGQQLPSIKGEQVIDLAGDLLVPAMREIHTHIDKTYFGGEWKAARPITNGIQTRIDEEKWLLPKQAPTSAIRARKMLDHYLAQGHTHIRTHVNIDPVMGTKQLEMVLAVLADYHDRITYEIVAFPQHGLLKSNSVGLVKEALTMGATHVGGVDPALVDRHVDRSIQQLFELAVEQDKKLDIHLHARDSLGLYEFEKFVHYAKTYHYQNKVTLSHAMALGDLTTDQITKLAYDFSEQGIDVATTIPIRNTTMPVLDLVRQNVQVSVGHDSLIDHWSPFGSGNTIEKLNTVAQRFSISDEYRLSRLLGLATNQVTPLDEQGNQVWPAVGDKANFFSVAATSTAHMIARSIPVNQVFSQGTLVAKQGEVCL